MKKTPTITETVKAWITRDSTDEVRDVKEWEWVTNPSDITVWREKPVMVDGNAWPARRVFAVDPVNFSARCQTTKDVADALGITLEKGCLIEITMKIQRPETSHDRAKKALKSRSVKMKNEVIQELLSSK